MTKKNSTYSEKKEDAGNGSLSASKQEYTKWLNVLEKYHTERFDRNYRKYTAYTETKGTKTKISDPVAPELVERVIQKLFERDPKFIAFARGKTLPKEITSIMSSTLEYFWTCPERVRSSGTMRSKLKVLGREFSIIGNGVTETYYNSESETPDARVIPTEDIIFNPTKTLKTSPRFYVRQYVSPDDFEEMAEQEDENGKVIKGRFKKDAVERVLKKYRDDDGKDNAKGFKANPDSNRINRSGSSGFDNPVEDILLVTKVEGTKICRYADWEELVEETEDPLGIGDDAYDFVMDIEIPKEPYGLSFLDLLNGLVTAKDLTLNQIIDYAAKALNPPLFVDPNTVTGINRQTLSNAWKNGGIVFAAPGSAQHQPMAPLPPIGFDLLGYIQQRAEGVSGIGAYTGGVPNAANDKTQGTKGGIEALIAQGISPIQDRQMNIEESIIEPMANKWLKMAGTLMGQNEIKYVMVTGEEMKWIKVTKGLLTGKITLKDLFLAEIIDQQGLQEVAQSLLGQGKDPETEVLFDIDWVVRVETGSMAEVDTAKDLQAFDGQIMFAKELGVQLDANKILEERAQRAGIKEFGQYLLQQPQGMQGQPAGMPGQPPVPGMPPQGQPVPMPQ